MSASAAVPSTAPLPSTSAMTSSAMTSSALASSALASVGSSAPPPVVHQAQHAARPVYPPAATYRSALNHQGHQGHQGLALRAASLCGGGQCAFPMAVACNAASAMASAPPPPTPSLGGSIASHTIGLGLAQPNGKRPRED